jgi:drug resistance transporter, bcr/cflA subfamily
VNQTKKTLTRKQMAALLAMLIALMPFSIDAYLPSLLKIAQSLSADIHQIEKSLSSFIFGVAIGQIIGGSLSDIKGRKNIALVGLSVYLLGCLGLIFVQTAEQLMILRIVQALGAGMSAVVVGALVRDNYHGKDAAQMFALIGIILMAAPLAAPMLGSMLQKIGGWRSIFVFLLLYAAMVFVLLFKLLPQHKQVESITATQLRSIGTRYVQVLQNKAALGFLFYQAASFSSMFSFLTESPFVYMQLYGLSPTQYSWVFIGNVIMMMICNRLTAFGLRYNWTSAKLLKIGVTIQMLANIALLILVFLMKLSSLWLLVLLVMISVGTQGLIVANTQTLFMSQYQPEVAGSANAILSAGQSLIAAGVGFLVTFLHNGTALTMVGMMFMATTCGLGLLMFFSREILRKN